MKKSHYYFCLAGLVAMTSGCTLTGMCNNDETKCVVDKEGVAYLQKCTDGIWAQESSPCQTGKCDENKLTCAKPECISGKADCDGKTARECKSGLWETKQC